jgi:hypothetical protein
LPTDSKKMAERVGFEPTVPVLPGHSLSRRALSTAQTPLRGSIIRLSEALMGLNLGVGGGRCWPGVCCAANAGLCSRDELALILNLALVTLTQAGVPVLLGERHDLTLF